MTLILTLKRSQGKKQFVMQLIIGSGGNSHAKGAEILIFPVRHSDLEQLCHDDARLRDSCRNTVGRALPYPTWQKTFSKLTRTYLPCCMISTQIKKHSAEAYIFRSLKTFKMQLKWQKSSIFKCNLLPAFIVFNESTNGTMNSNIHATWLSLEQTVE